ncbi:hypothetical protein B9G69_012375 [Bdellovibrio sp. SKB1291214]|uniref:hypothetical protein n=1 Tax=Bdellovibrio sp. SKB1291214 TaxID=1732569 RepID=UPI000B518A91|nr:hypothetical protein [Bdellovibrio sp. SKB1291214]UYL07842.1 hypothetical protein B9G69_012375 [Bdellovibrio sp. SKB1291214]
MSKFQSQKQSQEKAEKSTVQPAGKQSPKQPEPRQINQAIRDNEALNYEDQDHQQYGRSLKH